MTIYVAGTRDLYKPPRVSMLEMLERAASAPEDVRAVCQSVLNKLVAWRQLPLDQKRYSDGSFAIQHSGDGKCGATCFCCSDAWDSLTEDERIALMFLSADEFPFD